MCIAAKNIYSNVNKNQVTNIKTISFNRNAIVSLKLLGNGLCSCNIKHYITLHYPSVCYKCCDRTQPYIVFNT